MALTKQELVRAIRDFRDDEFLSKVNYNYLDSVIDTIEKITPSMVFIEHVMDKEQQRNMIDQFQEWYYNTDQDVETFSTEFCHVTNCILNNKIPTKLEFLVDYQNDLSDLLGISIEIV